MWRFSSRGVLVHGYPIEFQKQFPIAVEFIDAALERPSDNSLIFFSGSKFWSSPDGVNFKDAKSLAEIGLPKTIKQIDAAFVWGKNNRVYLFRGNWYWKLNDQFMAEPEYPKSISNWRGFSEYSNIDSVITSPFDGKSFYFRPGLSYICIAFDYAAFRGFSYVSRCLSKVLTGKSH